MKIQSLSVVVPNAHCINDCAFCVSKMHGDGCENRMDGKLPQYDLHLRDYIRRLEFARDNGCNTVMLTGSSEPQQNRLFLVHLGMIFQMMDKPFRWIEMQTTGVLLDEDYLRFLRSHVGVGIISLSVSALDDDLNAKYVGMPDGHRVCLDWLCSEIKRQGFGLRLSLNLTDAFAKYVDDPKRLFADCKAFGADQVTLRLLYSSGTGTPQDDWIKEHGLGLAQALVLKDYIRENGSLLGHLPHGADKYSIEGVCAVVDTDCMDKAEKEGDDYKYLILRPDCRLYSQWDDPASFVF